MHLRPLALALAVGLLIGCTDKPKSPDTPTTPPAETPKTGDAPKPKDETPKPAPKPRDIKDIKGPWSHAKVGDWIEFQPHFGQTDRVRHEIIAIEDNTIFFKLTNVTKDKVMNPKIPVSFEDAEKGFNPPETLIPTPSLIEEVELKVGDKTLKCVHFVREHGDNKTETWLCLDFPLNGGVVKTIQNGKLNADVVDFHKVD